MSFFKKIFSAFTRNERIAFLISSAVVVVSFVVVMSITAVQATNAVPTQGGSYTVGVVGQPEYVNPVTAQSETDLSLVKLIYSNVDDVANNISASPDGRTWTVHLKDGVTWQDGQKLTSDDVIFTVQSIQNPDSQSPLATAWQGVSANRVSELEVQFVLANPYAFFGDDLANLYILPKHIFGNIPPGNWHLSDDNLKPIGSGPYEFTSYSEQSDGFISSYNLRAWNGYAGNQALIQNLNFKFFTNDKDLMSAFDNGQIDGFGTMTSDNLAGIQRPYNLFAWRTPGYYAVFFNQSKNLALQDPAVREALSEAVDRDALVKTALDRQGVADYGPVPPNAPYYTATGGASGAATTNAFGATTTNASGTTTTNANTSPSQSLELASETLTQAGWQVASGTFRAKMIQAVSVPLTVNLTVPNIDFLVSTAQALQSDWQSIGVQTNIATDSLEDLTANTITNRAYESLLFGNVLGPSSDLYAFWDSSQRFSPGLNLAIYQNPNVDALVEAARQDMDEASRTQQFAEAQQDIVADNPAIFLYSPDYLYVTNKNVQGILPDFLVDPSDLSREMTAWYINVARVLK